MDYNNLNHKLCRCCLEEGIFTSIFSTEFAILPSDMLNFCTNIKVSKNDGLPAVICNNCIYRLSVAYHFKQQVENSDIRIRNYLGIRFYENSREVETNTEEPWPVKPEKKPDDDVITKKVKTAKRRSRYKPKTEEEMKKRGPKPAPKIPQVCYQCHKSFKCLAQLQMHLRTHSGEKPYPCNYCPKRFAQKHNLVIHLRIHSGEKPFVCEVCSKQFSAHGNFLAHKKIHTGIKDQVCPVCNKAFITTSDLSRHLGTHSGIKNYVCDVCQKSFSRNRDMVIHKKKIHLNEKSAVITHRCSECRKVFPTDENLEDHMKTVHPSIVILQSQQQQQPIQPAPMPILENHSIHNIAQSHHNHQIHPQFQIAPPSLQLGPAAASNFPNFQRLHPY